MAKIVMLFRVLVLAVFCALGATALLTSVQISPKHLKLRSSSLQIVCLADAPIAECHFKWSADPSAIYNLTGADDETRSALGGDATFRYHGRGLEHRECGLNLTLIGPRDEHSVVGCRVRDEIGAWRYAEMTLSSTEAQSVDVETHPHDVLVASLGQRLDWLCLLHDVGPLTRCAFSLPRGQRLDYSADTAGDEEYAYHGRGLELGECGLRIDEVRTEHNGWMVCELATSRVREFATATLIVAAAPEVFTLTTSRAGALLTATCLAQDSRPVASLTWYLNDVMLRRDALDDAAPPLVDAPWRWSHDRQSITQVVRVRVTPELHGARLECVMRHAATDVDTTLVTVIEEGGARAEGLEGEEEAPEDDYGYWLILIAVLVILVILATLMYLRVVRRCCFKPRALKVSVDMSVASSERNSLAFRRSFDASHPLPGGVYKDTVEPLNKRFGHPGRLKEEDEEEEGTTSDADDFVVDVHSESPHSVPAT